MPSPVELGQQTQLAFIQELILGTTPATPAGQILRWTGMDFGADAPYINNPELRTDMMTPAGRRGGLRGKGSIDGKLSYGTYDAFLAAVLGNFAWATNVVKVAPMANGSAASVVVASVGKTFTRATGSWVTDGFVVGDYIQTSGFTAPGNNGTFVISTISALVITCTTATGLVDDAGSATGKIARNVRPSFTVEKGHLANGNYMPFLGCVVDSVEMSGKVNDAVDIKIGLMGTSVSAASTATLFSSLTQPNTNNLITTWDGNLKKDTIAMGQVLSWNLKLNRNLDAAEVCGSSALYDIQPKSAKVTGSFELYFDSITQYSAFVAETDIAFQLNLGGLANLGYQIDLTKCRITKWGAPPKDGLMTQQVEFESFVPASGTNTSCMITRKP